MSNSDLLDEISKLRKQCLTNIDEDNDNLLDLHQQLLKWQQQIINNLNKFIEDKFHEIKQKYIEINRQQIHDLDILYENCLSNKIDNDTNEQYYSKLIENFNKPHSLIQIFCPKEINFNQYLQLKTDNHQSLILMNNANYLSLSSYKPFSTLSIQSNKTPLFATDDHLLIYHDHNTSSTSLHVFDLQNYLEQPTNIRSYLKLCVPCNQFQGKIMHIEYCLYIQGFLLATGSKLFTLKIPKACTSHRVTEYFDIMRGNFPGILQKFACHPILSNLLYLLINTFSQYILVQIDLSKNFHILKQWDYPKDDNYKNNLQLTTINDFVLGKDILIFAVTYESNDNSSSQSYEFHIRSSDMSLQYRLVLKSTFCPLHLCIIPHDYSSTSNKQEQFLVIFEKNNILSLYDTNPINIIDKMILDIEPEYIGFIKNNSSILLIRNLFHIAIYKQMDNNNTNISLSNHK